MSTETVILAALAVANVALSAVTFWTSVRRARRSRARTKVLVAALRASGEQLFNAAKDAAAEGRAHAHDVLRGGAAAFESSAKIVEEWPE